MGSIVQERTESTLCPCLCSLRYAVKEKDFRCHTGSYGSHTAFFELVFHVSLFCLELLTLNYSHITLNYSHIYFQTADRSDSSSRHIPRPCIAGKAQGAEPLKT